jgi:hypothetical protein
VGSRIASTPGHRSAGTAGAGWGRCGGPVGVHRAVRSGSAHDRSARIVIATHVLQPVQCVRCPCTAVGRDGTPRGAAQPALLPSGTMARRVLSGIMARRVGLTHCPVDRECQARGRVRSAIVASVIRIATKNSPR